MKTTEHPKTRSTSGNALIDMIDPIPTTMVELKDALSSMPDDFDPAHRKEDKLSRLLRLDDLDLIYVPTSRDMRSGVCILRMLYAGYKNRRPNAAHWREHKARCEALGQKSAKKKMGSASAPSFAIVGVSGAGKSTSTENLLAEIPQVIEQDQTKNTHLPRFQIVWIKVTCPVNRSPRAFIIAFFIEVDRLTGSNYAKAYARQSIDELISSMGKVANLHFLGLLVIDEIQNAVTKEKDGDRKLLKLLVNITGTVRVPIVFIGTPKCQSVLNAELADARRMLGPKWVPFAADDEDWIAIIETLWRFQYTRIESPLNEKLLAKVFELTQGIPALAKSLYCLAQERAIIFSSKEKSDEITTDLLDETFKEDMQSVHGAVQALKLNAGFEVYDDLFPEKLPAPGAWEEDHKKIKALAQAEYEDSYVRTARNLGKQEAVEDLLGVSK